MFTFSSDIEEEEDELVSVWMDIVKGKDHEGDDSSSIIFVLQNSIYYILHTTKIISYN